MARWLKANCSEGPSGIPQERQYDGFDERKEEPGGSFLRSVAKNSALLSTESPATEQFNDDGLFESAFNSAEFDAAVTAKLKALFNDKFGYKYANRIQSRIESNLESKSASEHSATRKYIDEGLFESAFNSAAFDAAMTAKCRSLLKHEFGSEYANRIQSQIESNLQSRFASAAFDSTLNTELEAKLESTSNTNFDVYQGIDTETGSEWKNSGRFSSLSIVPDRMSYAANSQKTESLQEKFPTDSYSFVALGPSKKLPFIYGCSVCFLQFSLLWLMFFSKTFLFKSDWRPYSENENIDNPDQKIDKFNGGAFIPANTSVIVRITQILAILVFMVLGGDSLEDFSKALMNFPITTERKYFWLQFSFFLRGLQGLLGIFTAMLLVLTATDAIDIVLNFTAVHYISSFDDVAFRLAESRFYGITLKQAAENIKKKYLPDCTLELKNPVCYHYLYIIIVCTLGSLFLAIATVIIVFGERNDVRTTTMLRVEFDKDNLRKFGGCFKATDVEHHRRIAYEGIKLMNNDTATLAYCQPTHQWVFHEKGPEENPCNISDAVLARSSVTFSFDISTVFDAPWFSPWNRPIAVSFVENEKNNATEGFFYCGSYPNDGQCDEALNNFDFQFDGGDCCGSTCTYLKGCGGNPSFESVFELELENEFASASVFGFPSCSNPDVVSRQARVEIHLDEIRGLNDTGTAQLPYLKLDCIEDGTESQILSVPLSKKMVGKAQEVRIITGSECNLTTEIKTPNYDNSSTTDSSKPEGDFDPTKGSGSEEIAGTNDNKETTAPTATATAAPTATPLGLDFHVVQLLEYSGGSGSDEPIKLVTHKGDSKKENEFDIRPFRYSTELEMVQSFFSASDTIPTEIGQLKFLTKLNLTEFELNGTIPTEIGQLRNLIHLDLSSNQFTGPIPSEMVQLTALKHLDLSYNQFSGPFRSEIDLLNVLTYLNLRDNQFNDTILKEITQLASLTYLDLAWNNFDGVIPTEMVQLASLTNLDVGSNKLTGFIPSEIGEMKSLKLLHLYFNQFSGTAPIEIQNLTSPHVDVNIYGCCKLSPDEEKLRSFRGSIPTTIGQLSNLTHVDLSLKGFIGSIPTEIGELTSLTSLTFYGNSLSGTIPTEIGLLTSLTYLSFTDNKLTGPIPAEIEFLKSLETLSFWKNKLSGTIPSEIGLLNNLTYLDFENNELDGAIPIEIGRLTNLEKLYLGLNRFNGTIPSEILDTTIDVYFDDISEESDYGDDNFFSSDYSSFDDTTSAFSDDLFSGLTFDDELLSDLLEDYHILLTDPEEVPDEDGDVLIR